MMDIYTVTVEAAEATAVSLPLGGHRYDYSMYQDGDGMWQRVPGPGRVAVLRGFVMVAVEGYDVGDVSRRIGREVVIALDEPPACAPGGLYVDLRNVWRICAVDISADERYAHASDRPRIWASRLRVAAFHVNAAGTAGRGEGGP